MFAELDTIIAAGRARSPTVRPRRRCDRARRDQDCYVATLPGELIGSRRAGVKCADSRSRAKPGCRRSSGGSESARDAPVPWNARRSPIVPDMSQVERVRRSMRVARPPAGQARRRGSRRDERASIVGSSSMPVRLSSGVAAPALEQPGERRSRATATGSKTIFPVRARAGSRRRVERGEHAGGVVSTRRCFARIVDGFAGRLLRERRGVAVYSAAHRGATRATPT